MSKWTTNRQILFDKGTQTSDVTPLLASKTKIKAQKEIIVIKEPTSAGIYKWLKTHPLINTSGLCALAECDKANFRKTMLSGKPLKDELLKKVVQILTPYGYAE